MGSGILPSEIDHKTFLIGLFFFIIIACSVLLQGNDKKQKHHAKARKNPNKNKNAKPEKAKKKKKAKKEKKSNIVAKSKPQPEGKGNEEKKGDGDEEELDVLKGKGAFASAAAQVSRLGKKRPKPKKEKTVEAPPNDNEANEEVEVNYLELYNETEKREDMNILYNYATESPYSSSIIRSRKVNLHQSEPNSTIVDKHGTNEYLKTRKFMETASVMSMSFIQFLFPVTMIVEGTMVWLTSNSLKTESALSSNIWRLMTYSVAICCLTVGILNFARKCYSVNTQKNRTKICFVGYFLLSLSSLGFIYFGCVAYQQFYSKQRELNYMNQFNISHIGTIGYVLIIASTYLAWKQS